MSTDHTDEVEPRATVRRSDLLNALDEVLTQLEGWVAWKCPKRHRAEHDAFIAKYRFMLARAKGVRS